MGPIRRNTVKLAWALLLSAVLMIATSPTVLGSPESPSVQIVGYQVVGDVVSVTMHNSGSATSGTLSVQAMVKNLPQWSFATFELGPGQTESVPVTFTNQPQSVMSLGVSDLGDPF